MSDKHPIDELFKQQLEKHSITPSGAAWEKIAAATQSKKAGFKPMYLMRAAMITLFIGISGWVYLQNNPQNLSSSQQQIEVPLVENQPKKENTEAPKEVTNAVKKEEGGTEKPAASQSSAVKKVPVLKRSTGTSAQKILVSNPSPALNQEPVETENFDLQAQNVELDPVRVAEVFEPRLKIKLKLNKPVTEEWIAESKATPKEEKTAFTDKVFAYANDQFQNLKAGKKLELPKAPKGKPQFEINLDKIFN